MLCYLTDPRELSPGTTCDTGRATNRHACIGTPLHFDSLMAGNYLFLPEKGKKKLQCSLHTMAQPTQGITGKQQPSRPTSARRDAARGPLRPERAGNDLPAYLTAVLTVLLLHTCKIYTFHIEDVECVSHELLALLAHQPLCYNRKAEVEQEPTSE